MSIDYKTTIFLPQTDFPMRGGLPKREPEFLARWQAQDLFNSLRDDARGRKKFVLHDGPPYANGHLHIGHALNKILKDVITRSQQMMGRDSHYVPGWDCHGLPIEWQVEQDYKKSGKNKDAIDIIQFRRECREFADKWINTQRDEFRRLGVEGDWENRYSTMDYEAEAQIAREICKFLMNGGLYKGSKPVMWSVVEKTALAEAEVEYHEHTSRSVFARFQLVARTATEFNAAAILIWTTTPWTLPGNRAIAYGEEIDYVVATVRTVEKSSLAQPGEKLVVAVLLADSIKAESGVVEWDLSGSFKGTELNGLICRHPFHGNGYEFEVPLLPGKFVGTDQGTGFVHIAPGHGADDFELGQQFGLPVPDMLDDDGYYRDSVPVFSGKCVLLHDGKEGDANLAVISKLNETSNLFAQSDFIHSYPHSWRSKAPVIFRNTPQWFISMNENNLRKKALRSIEKVRWVPPQGRSRIYSMVESRPEWVVSRQRAWGVPIPVFVNKATGEPLRDSVVNERICSAFETEGSDAWFSKNAISRFLKEDYNADDWQQVTDIVDVWFESGCSHAFVLEKREQLTWPASLYLEGTDQHRGWFHSSLLEACGTRGKAPFEAVLTHGFVMDGDGRKMSKSLGNIVSPQKVVEKFGADILRLWVVSSDYSEDLRIGDEILQGQVDAYRKIRNTVRYVLGNLSGFAESESVATEEMPSLEQWILHRLYELDILVREGCNNFDFHGVYVALHNFCINDLSAFYFDVRKDVLYCDRADSSRRRSVRTVLDTLFDCLTAWLAPILCFTAEEAWLARYGEEVSSVHLRQFPTIPAAWKSENLDRQWKAIRRVRKVVNGALELERQEKRIGSSLEAHPKVYLDSLLIEECAAIELSDICITSSIEIVEGDPPTGSFSLDDVHGVAVVMGDSKGFKCGRCWKVLPDVKNSEATCNRCTEALSPSKKDIVE